MKVRFSSTEPITGNLSLSPYNERYTKVKHISLFCRERNKFLMDLKKNIHKRKINNDLNAIELDFIFFK